MRPGDSVRVHCSAGQLSGTLVDTPGDALPMKLAHGAEVQIPRADIRKLFLVHKTSEPHPGCSFSVRSKSGNRYAGEVHQVLPDGRLMVKLRSGGTADLHTDKLDLESLELLLDLPPDAAVGVVAKIEPLAPILEEPEEEPAEPKDPEQLKQQLERERSSSRKLKRILEDVLSEREDLKEQVIEGRRALESEVWRGMARNKELTSKLRKLEEQLGSDDDEGEGR